jgi:hypothetical protein
VKHSRLLFYPNNTQLIYSKKEINALSIHEDTAAVNASATDGHSTVIINVTPSWGML